MAASIADLMNDVASVIPAKWRAVGIQLGLSSYTLDNIQRENAGKPQACLESFEQMFIIWKRHGPKPYTWNTIVDVLRTPAVGQSALAKDLCAKYFEVSSSSQIKVTNGRQAYFEEALKHGEVEVAYGRVMIIGTAGVGKTTLLGALMNEPLKEAKSTLMADTRVVKCQSTDENELKEQNQSLPEEATSNTKALNFQWKRADWCNVTEEDEVKELALLATKVMDIGSDQLLEDLKLSIAVKVFNPEVLLPSQNADSHNSDSDKSVRRSFEVDAYETLSDIIAAARSYMVIPLEPTTDQYLNVWDCGGQRVFLDVLPAFLTSRTIFLLMFDASKGLQEKVEVIWNEEGISNKLETLGMSSQDLLIQWMSCINASLSIKAKKLYERQHSQKCIIPPFPRIVVIGTHGDKLGSDVKKSITLELTSSYKKKPFSDQIKDPILILDSTKRGNKTDPAIKTLKRIVGDFVSKELCFPTPTSWVLFRKLVTKLTKSRPIVSLDNIKVICKACLIDDTALLSVLSFYHELGVFLHYADIEKLKDKVIAQPEWLVKHIGRILAPKESGQSSVGPPEAWDLLRENGVLVEPLYQEVWKTSNTECEVEPQAFADLLEHFSLIAEIKQEVPFTSWYKGKKYFMPCALSICPHNVMKTLSDEILVAATLHLTFSINYVPPGFFIRLATVLSKSEGFNIAFILKMYSNQITFQYGDENGRIDDVTIAGTNFSIQVDVVRRFSCHDVKKYNFHSICRSILKILLEAVCELQSWFPSIAVKPGFQCECSKGLSPHFVGITIGTESSCSLACAGTSKCPTAEQQLWLKIPITTDKEGSGDLSKTEIKKTVVTMKDEDFNQLSKALEMKTKNKFLALDGWSCKMGNLARSHLEFHLHRIGLSDLAERIKSGSYKNGGKENGGQDQAHVFNSVMNDEKWMDDADNSTNSLKGNIWLRKIDAVKHFRDIYDRLQESLNPDDITGKLYTARMLSTPEHDEVNHLMYTTNQRTTKLLAAVERAISVDPENFLKFLNILETETRYKPIVLSARASMNAELSFRRFGDQDQQTSSKEGPLENEGQQLRNRRPDVGCPTLEPINEAHDSANHSQPIRMSPRGRILFGAGVLMVLLCTGYVLFGLYSYSYLRGNDGNNAPVLYPKVKKTEDKPSMADLMNNVAAEIPTKWRAVGIQLGLPTGTLDSIQSQSAGGPHSPSHSFEQMLDEWRRGRPSPYTWRTIIGVLRTPSVGEGVLAERLEAKYLSEHLPDGNSKVTEADHMHKSKAIMGSDGQMRSQQRN